MNTSNGTGAGEERIGVGRRQLMGAAAAVGLTVARPEIVRAFQANSKIRVGMIGCGARGQWISKLFTKHGGCQIVAAHDYFQDRTVDMNNTMAIIKAPLIDESMRFTGLSGYKRLLDKAPGAIDAVVLISPPYFRPEQAAAAVAAGVHGYLAKPVAVDVPGALSIEASGKKATEAKRVFLVDFQLRAGPHMQQAVKMVRDGAIGKAAIGESNYFGGDPFGRHGAALKAKPTDPEARMRGWGLDVALSGDILVEQAIHNIDLATWLLDAAPVAASALRGRNVRVAGDCADYYAALFEFPNGVAITLQHRQYGGGFDCFCRLQGSAGTFFGHYTRGAEIDGKTKFRQAGDVGESGTAANIADFHDRIVKGQVDNPTVAPTVRSNLACVLAREAAFAKREVTWDAMLKRAERMDAKLQGLKD
jgi:predicted dehydrogenase